MQKFNDILQMIARGIFQVFSYFATVIFAGLLILLFVNVLARNLFNGSYAWIDEITKYMFCWMMFLGISIGVYRKKHLGVEFVVSKMPARVQEKLDIITTILTILFFGVLVVYGIVYVRSTLSMRSPVMNIRYGVVYACVPLCGALSIFYCIARLLGEAVDKKKEAE